MTAMFRSFTSVNYRIWFLGALVSNIGGWMQATAQDWVVLTELTNNDATAMGVTMALQFGPPLVLVSLTGWVADRFDRRNVLLLTQTTLMLLAIAVAVLLLAGVMTLPLMFCFAAAFGVANAFDAPARQAFVSDMVSRDDMANAVALNSASFNLARLAGPALGGILIVLVGTGWVFILNAVTFLAMLVALLLIRREQLLPTVRGNKRGGIAEGFRYVAKRGDLVVTFVMVFLIGAFGMNFPIYASTMALEFGRAADGYGLLSSVLAIGSLTGALLAARRAHARMRVIILAAGGFGIAAITASLMPTYVMFAIALIFVGFSTVTILTTANAYVQTTTDGAVRGRVLALYMAVIMGSTPVGAPIAGWIVDAISPRAALTFGGIMALLAFVIGTVWTLRSGRVHRSDSSRFRLTIDETLPISVIEDVAEQSLADVAAITTPIRLPRSTVSPPDTTERLQNGRRPESEAAASDPPRVTKDPCPTGPVDRV